MDRSLDVHFESAADAMVVVDLEGVILDANRRAHELFGYSSRDLVGLHHSALVPEDVRAGHGDSHGRFVENPTTRFMSQREVPLRALRADGSIFPAEISLSPVGNDETMTVLAVVRDITARTARDVESEMIRQSLDSVDEAVFMFRVDSLEFCYVNEGATRQTGYGRHELVGGMTPLTIKPEYDRESFGNLIAPLLSGERNVVTFETVHLRKDQSRVPVEVLLQRAAVAHEGKECLMAFVRDISLRREQELRLVRSEQAFRSAFEDAPVGMAIADLTAPGARTIVAANEALAEMLGFDAADLIGKDFESLTHPDDREADAEAAGQLASGSLSLYRTQKRYVHADGHVVTALLSAAPLRTPEGTRSLAHVVDVSRQVAAEAERDQRVQFLSFLGDIRLAVLADSELDDVLALILHSATRALDAGYGMIVMLDPLGVLRVRAVAGTVHGLTLGDELPEGSLEAMALGSGEVLVLHDLHRRKGLSPAARRQFEGIGPAVFSPLVVKGAPIGVLEVARPIGGALFDTGDLDASSSLAAEGALALEFHRAREERAQLRLAEDRERIARELQDRVIQRLFAAGMTLQAAMNSSRQLSERAPHVVEEIDHCVTLVRDTIFKLEQNPDRR